MTDAIQNPFFTKIFAAENTKVDPNFPLLLPPQFAQSGEDLIVVALVKAYCTRRGIKEQDQTYCEIGAYHPVIYSSTYLLNQSLGMTGVLVDANEKLIANLRAQRPHDTVVHAAITDSESDKVVFTLSTSPGLSSLDEQYVQAWAPHGYGVAERIEVPAMHIDHLFKTYFEAKPPVYLSIDVEGMDIRLLQSLNWQVYRPYIVQAEPSDFFLIDGMETMISIMRAADYGLVAKTDANLIFVDMRDISLPSGRIAGMLRKLGQWTRARRTGRS